jgi:hypothetical protein
MDGHRFDAWTRHLSQRSSRRRALRALAGAGGLLGLSGGRAAARPRCRADGHPCAAAGDCCSGYCPRAQRQRRLRRCAPCAGVGCGDLCCPAETVGCTELKLPDGTVVVGCLCKEGTKWEPETNQCVPCPVDCASDDECCEGLCCDGHCCVCREPGSPCRVDADCCGEIVNGDQETGRCLDGVCRCCAQGAISGSVPCPGEWKPGPDICCEWPQFLVACCDCSSCTFSCCTNGLDCFKDDPEGPFHCPRGTEWTGAFANTSCWSDGPPA